MPQRKKTPRQSAGKIVAEAIKRDKALSALLEPDALSPSGARRAINKLEVSEEWRLRLRRVVRLAVQAGGRVYPVGLKIIETIVDLKKRYPDTSAALLAGGVLTLLASWIPVLGGALAPIIASVTIGLATVAFIVEFVKKQFKSLRDALAQ